MNINSFIKLLVAFPSPISSTHHPLDKLQACFPRIKIGIRVYNFDESFFEKNKFCRVANESDITVVVTDEWAKNWALVDLESVLSTIIVFNKCPTTQETSSIHKVLFQVSGGKIASSDSHLVATVRDVIDVQLRDHSEIPVKLATQSVQERSTSVNSINSYLELDALCQSLKFEAVIHECENLESSDFGSQTTDFEMLLKHRQETCNLSETETPSESRCDTEEVFDSVKKLVFESKYDEGIECLEMLQQKAKRESNDLLAFRVMMNKLTSFTWRITDFRQPSSAKRKAIRIAMLGATDCLTVASGLNDSKLIVSAATLCLEIAESTKADSFISKTYVNCVKAIDAICPVSIQSQVMVAWARRNKFICSRSEPTASIAHAISISKSAGSISEFLTKIDSLLATEEVIPFWIKVRENAFADRDIVRYIKATTCLLELLEESKQLHAFKKTGNFLANQNSAEELLKDRVDDALISWFKGNANGAIADCLECWDRSLGSDIELSELAKRNLSLSSITEYIQISLCGMQLFSKNQTSNDVLRFWTNQVTAGNVKDPNHQSRGFVCKANAIDKIITREFQGAADQLRQSSEYFSKTNLDVEIAENHFLAGLIHLRQRAPIKALGEFAICVKYCQKTCDVALLNHCCYHQAYCFQQMGRGRLFRKLITRAVRTDHLKSLSQIQANIEKVEGAGMFGCAYELQKRHLEICLRSDDLSLVIRSRRTLAKYSRSCSRFSESLQQLELVKEHLVENQGESGSDFSAQMASVLNSEGAVWMDIGDYDKALETLQDSLDFCGADLRKGLHTINTLCLAFRKNDRCDEALSLNSIALKFLYQNSRPEQLAIALNVRSQILFEMGKYRDAESAINEAIKLIESSDRHKTERTLSHLYFRRAENSKQMATKIPLQLADLNIIVAKGKRAFERGSAFPISILAKALLEESHLLELEGREREANENILVANEVAMVTGNRKLILASFDRLIGKPSLASPESLKSRNAFLFEYQQDSADEWLDEFALATA